MPLPTDDITWPPVSMMAVYSKMAEWAAWYSGEPTRIMAVYAMNNATAQVNPWWRFWTRARAGNDGAQRSQLHVPIASDLAMTSAALIFGEPATVRIRSARETPTDSDAEPMQDPETGDMVDPMTGSKAAGIDTPFDAAVAKAKLKVTGPSMTPEQKAEARLLQIIEEGDIDARLIEAAEGCAAMGGVYIYPVWDENLRPFPLLGIAQADQAVPEFQHGILTAVTFHRTVLTDGNRILRHLERHEMQGTGAARHCVILNGVFQGTEDRLGIQMGLGVADSLSELQLQPQIDTPFEDLDVEYIPNMRPNRLWRATSYGVADIQGSEGLLDALDEVYASWIRDIRLAKARILVPREYLRRDPSDKGLPTFDVDQEIYVGMDMEPGAAADTRSMMAHQFQIRYKEHQETAHELIDRIVSSAGYTPSTLGAFSDKTTGTGTALRISEHKTLLTLKRKSAWWRTGVANTLYRMQIVDHEVFGQSTPVIRPTVTLSNSIIDNPLELAQTALALFTAQASSIETRVRIVNPDWDESEIDAEVQRVKDEEEATAKPPSIVTSPGQLGAPHTDAASTHNLPVNDQAKTPPANKPPVSPPQAPQVRA